MQQDSGHDAELTGVSRWARQARCPRDRRWAVVDRFPISEYARRGPVSASLYQASAGSPVTTTSTQLLALLFLLCQFSIASSTATASQRGFCRSTVGLCWSSAGSHILLFFSFSPSQRPTYHNLLFICDTASARGHPRAPLTTLSSG